MPQKYGWQANQEQFERRACLVCDNAEVSYSWTDYSGEGACNTCGTPYQLKWGELKEGESYPRLNVRADIVPMLRRYYAETGGLNGLGSYFGFDDYPEQLLGRRRFNAWFKEHEAEYAEFARKADDSQG